MKEAPEYPGTSYVPEVEEAARKSRERRLVEEGNAVWEQRKEELSRQRRRDQQQLKKMLAQYHPWGKPGGGAPCAATLRKKNVRLYSPEPPRRIHSSFRLRSRFADDILKYVLRRNRNPRARTIARGFSLMARFLRRLLAGKRAPVTPKINLWINWLRNRTAGGRKDSKSTDIADILGWTIRSPRIDRSDIDPLAITDMNKFYDAKATYGISPDPYPGPMPPLDPKNRYNEDVEVYKLTGGVELVPLLTSSRYQSHPQAIRYLATDATRPGYTLESLRALRSFGTGSREYVADLAQQIHRKRERVVEEQRWEQENCRRHYDTWRRLWGRPGHGAPMDHCQRANLYNILYRPAIY
ncbi:uncharacterized protein [Neodiprion pinetum]|nr:uncharacterized protein LOC124217208 [Neodiprion pinetum]